MFALWLLFDTQQLMGHKGEEVAIAPEEYVFAALCLYFDIIEIFRYVLMLISLCSE